MDALFCPNDGSPLSLAPAGDGGMATVVPDPYLGRELSGHIEIRQLVGVGAMGRVYRAFQRGIDRDVAVKILHRELSANQQLVARFHREAKVASRLLHPNVVGVHLVGQLPDGSMYIVMEYLDGLSLQSALAAAGGAFDLPRALHVALQLCDATGEAHATGVVHRDLKPENVMLVRRGADPDFVKVLDFGIARLNWGEQSMATAAGLIFGTARYISPEGAQGEAVGPPGDVYATATLVYQMLAGRTPFEGEQAVALLVQQIHDSPPPLRSIVRASYVPEPIAEVVMRNLSKDPLAREPDGRALGRALMDAAKLAGLSAEDFVSRPLLQSVRPAVQLPAMQRTSRMQLEPEAREALKSPVPATSPIPPGVSPVTAPMPAQPARPPAPPTPTPPPAAAATPEPKPAGVETTLDDIPAPPPAALGHDRTQKVQPLEALPPPAAPPGAMRGSFPSAPSPSFDAEEDLPESEPPEVKRRRARSRAVSLFVVCFLIGVIGAAVV
ncbi:MAG TPA: serine/threonine-protein kinase, partial [Polyangiaceae bacterium]|nr:serine/threonine-protein kinase [Polyangiaceae bacterium]